MGTPIPPVSRIKVKTIIDDGTPQLSDLNVQYGSEPVNYWMNYNENPVTSDEEYKQRVKVLESKFMFKFFYKESFHHHTPIVCFYTLGTLRKCATIDYTSVFNKDVDYYRTNYVSYMALLEGYIHSDNQPDIMRPKVKNLSLIPIKPQIRFWKLDFIELTDEEYSKLKFFMEPYEEDVIRG